MKKTLMIFAAIVMMAGFSTTVMAQTLASATTAAGTTLIVPMGITQTAALHFGNVTLVNATGGTVMLSTANVRTFGGTGGVSASAIDPTSTNAAYDVTGTYNQTYALTLPATITVTETVGATAILTVSALTVKFGAELEKTAVAATSVMLIMN